MPILLTAAPGPKAGTDTQRGLLSMPCCADANRSRRVPTAPCTALLCRAGPASAPSPGESAFTGGDQAQCHSPASCLGPWGRAGGTISTGLLKKREGPTGKAFTQGGGKESLNEGDAMAEVLPHVPGDTLTAPQEVLLENLRGDCGSLSKGWPLCSGGHLAPQPGLSPPGQVAGRTNVPVCCGPLAWRWRRGHAVLGR